MRFETKQDLQNEHEVINEFYRFTDSMPKKLDKNDIDYALYRDNKLVAYAEVKCYTSPSNKYGFQILSMIKIVKLQEYDKKAPAFFVLKYSDNVIYFIRVRDIEGSCKYNGRKQRVGSTNDFEMLVYCDKKKMTKLIIE